MRLYTAKERRITRFRGSLSPPPRSRVPTLAAFVMSQDSVSFDGIALSREAPGALNEGEIVVASNEELRAAPLSGKQLLALWNALPGVEKRKKVADRAEP